MHGHISEILSYQPLSIGLSQVVLLSKSSDCLLKRKRQEASSILLTEHALQSIVMMLYGIDQDLWPYLCKVISVRCLSWMDLNASSYRDSLYCIDL